ncbi:hypothetical protein DP107_16900 [Haloglomus irregulare]|uniref:Uncharacterized protein n=1 Tax=Haloglomus irregulare TaxID=2234134 RepID=A0A554MVP2_9EURY|nr:hypothetical protein DP107_16900 [Haloglomus irregulare]
MGTALVERVRVTHEDRTLGARVLSNAAEGGEFYEQFGLHQSGRGHSTIGGEEYSVALLTERIRAEQ